HVTRGRANSLRLALSGQLGRDALVSDDMRRTMELCLSCKGCKRECPVGVDMARMKIEFLHQYRQAHALTARERLIAYLPRYAPHAARARAFLNLRDRIPGLAQASEHILGFAAKRSLPKWRKPWRAAVEAGEGGPAALFVDTFSRWFEPETARAAERVLGAAGYAVRELAGDGRPLCCGRTFLGAGLIAEARAEMRRLAAALAPLAEAQVPVIGLEPSCVLALRDELPALLPDPDARAATARVLLFDEFVAARAERFAAALGPLPRKAVLHTHCHQKAHDLGGTSAAALALVPQLEVASFDSTCCGMAGAFGYEAEHYDLSLRIGELSVLPRMRQSTTDELLVAAGTSCRHQIGDAAGREAVHPARILDRASA
ncbi:MAG: (Fe-S)-binding protein, partial [Stellaceae bacterium]